MKKPYQEVQIQKKSSKKVFFVSCLFIFSISFVTLLSVFISPIINITRVASTNNYIYEKSYYFVMLNTMTSNKKEAEKESQNIKARGGAGVLMFKNSYLVVTSCYDNEAQAQSVCQSLSTEEENFVVEEEKISIDLKPFSKEEKEILLSHLTFFETNIIEIYNLSNSLDQNNASSILANLKLKSIKLEADSITNSLIKSDERFEGVKKAFLSFESALEYGSEQSHLNSAIVPYSSVLREIIIHSVISFCEINKNN